MGKNSELSTMQISKTMRKELAKLGNKGDSYEDIIKRLYNHWKKTH